MTNGEKYNDVIGRITRRYPSLHPAVINGKVVQCIGQNCAYCDLNQKGDGCTDNYEKWLLEEAEPDIKPAEVGERVNKEPRKMDFAEYIVEIQHTHTWYRPDNVLPPPNEDVIVDTKETLSCQCAFYIDPEDIFLDANISNDAVFFDKKHVPHTKSTGIEKGFYVELPLGNKNPQYQLVSVRRWTDCPSIGVNAEFMNVVHTLRQYFKQAGRTKKAVKKIMQLVMNVYGENPVYWGEEEK